MTNDEFTGIFDNLNPDDFTLETSAIDETSRENLGVEAFNAFVDEQLRALRISYAAADGELISPVSILASPVLQRVFSAEDDENMGQYVARLHREAKRMGATWVFTSKQTLVGTALMLPDDMVDINDSKAVDKAIEEGRMEEGIFWYAERREGDERHNRQGIIRVVGNKLGAMTEGPAQQQIPLMAQILGEA